MKGILKAMVTITVGLVLLAIDAAAQSPRSWNFDSDPQSGIAKGFTNEFGSWQVTADTSPPS
jgi:hypothetical protein